jgi:hypothetical protein
MGSMTEMEASPSVGTARGGSEEFVCDFCGKTVARVRRIALDRDYDRLQKPHVVQYACDGCSEEKERRRLGADRG